MTQDRDFKRLVRHRMRKTGESYVSARAHLRRADPAGHATSERSGDGPMYPFERFTNAAKRALTRAQFEAEVGNSPSIATTHLLLGLLHDRETMAVAVIARLAPGLLMRLLHDQAGIRQVIEGQPVEGAAQESGGPAPSEPVKRAVEFAFAEAQLTGDGSVGTGHLLVGMLRVETSSGARVLAELGVTLDEARAKLWVLTQSGAVGESSTPERKPPDRDLTEWMEAAQVLARREESSSVRIDHLLRAAPRNRAAMDLFRQLGIDVQDALATVPPPPAQLSAVEASLVQLVGLRRQGAQRLDVDPPVQLDEAERAARDEWRRIHGEWIQSWGPSPREH